MARSDIAALLALGAALFIAVGDVIHQRSAHTVTDEPVGYLIYSSGCSGTVSGGWAARSRGWLLGLQAAALGLGSVLLVQALLVTSAAFRAADQRPPRRPAGQSPGMAVGSWLAASVAVIVTVGNPTAGLPAQGSRCGPWSSRVAPALLACVAGARALAGRPAAAVLLGLVSGSVVGCSPF